MNWKDKFKNKIFLLVFLLIGITTIVIYLNNSFEIKINKKVLGNSSKNSEKLQTSFTEISPSGQKQVILYERSFNGRDEIEYSNYLSNQYIFAVKEFDKGRENYIFIGDNKVGYPHWLGNDFIFFTGGCGAGCRSLYLVNTNSRTSSHGLIETTPISKDGFKTYFRDWFNNTFQFDGWDKNIRSNLIDGKVYLIFEMWNNGKYIGEKKFLFTGAFLKEL